LVGNCIILAASLFAVIARDGSGITGSLVGLSISYALQVVTSLSVSYIGVSNNIAYYMASYI